jgi:UDP-glucose 4-epimerase
MSHILITGGAGYIGSHTYVALTQAGLTPVILDNFSNSHFNVLERLQHITNQPVLFEKGDVTDTAFVQNMLVRYDISAVIHFAGFKAVSESVSQPLDYYRNNLGGIISLLQSMEAVNCRSLVFSSSATVYGDPVTVPITESFPRGHTNPYGHTKLVCEDILTSLRSSNPAWCIGTLRYFNPVGAHSSGLIGESPIGIPNNLMPYVTQVAVGKQPYLNVYGNDYPTPDGTGIRDYIHVMDLAQGHVVAINALLQNGKSFTLNLGTGRGHSVLEVINTFRNVSGQEIPYKFVPRRSGDIASCYADASLAARLLGWNAKHSLTDMCQDAWRWQKNNPNGYSH